MVGFRMEAGRVVVTDPIAIFTRPGWFYMAQHSTLSCDIAVAFAVAVCTPSGGCGGVAAPCS
jgi:hypothetical protein